ISIKRSEFFCVSKGIYVLIILELSAESSFEWLNPDGEKNETMKLYLLVLSSSSIIGLACSNSPSDEQWISIFLRELSKVCILTSRCLKSSLRPLNPDLIFWLKSESVLAISQKTGRNKRL